jgi:hypothetical protein
MGARVTKEAAARNLNHGGGDAAVAMQMQNKGVRADLAFVALWRAGMCAATFSLKCKLLF